jgi:transposase
VSRWRSLERLRGDPTPGPLGGDRRSGRIDAVKDEVLAALGPGKDATLREVQAALARRGLAFGFGTIQRFFRRHAITLKKRPRTRQNKTARTS